MQKILGLAVACLSGLPCSIAAAESPAAERNVMPTRNALLRNVAKITPSMVPLVAPGQVPALNLAKQTLTAAQAEVARAVVRHPKTTIGFFGQTLHLGKPSFGNENALYAVHRNGARYHIGYAMEMRIEPSSNEKLADGTPLAPVVPIVVRRDGKIVSTLFRGEQAVFAVGHKGISAVALAEVADQDLSSRKPLDHQAKVLQRAQARMIR